MQIKMNRKAATDYEQIRTYDAGIVLSGSEVKSAKSGLVQLEGSFVRIRSGEAWVTGMKIALYPKASLSSIKRHVADRPKKLLLNKREIEEISGLLSAQGLTVIPISVYSSRRLVKVKIAVCRGLRKFDKREAIKKKEFRRRLNSRVR